VKLTHSSLSQVQASRPALPLFYRASLPGKYATLEYKRVLKSNGPGSWRGLKPEEV